MKLSSLLGGAFEIEHLSVDAQAGAWGSASWEGALRIDGYDLKAESGLAFDELHLELANGVVRGARNEDLYIRELQARAAATEGLAHRVDVAIFANEVRHSRGGDETLPWLEGLLIEFRPDAGRLDVRVAEATLHMRGHEVVTGIVAALHVAALDAGAIVVDRGVLELPGMRVEDQPLHVQAHLDAARLSRSEGNTLRGTFRVAGSDGGLVLDMLQASESLRLTLSLIDGQPFVVAGIIERSGDATLLTETQLESGEITARGSMRLRPSASHGRFQVTYGGLRLGICAGPSGSELVLEPDPWSGNARAAGHASTPCHRMFEPGRKIGAPGGS